MTTVLDKTLLPELESLLKTISSKAEYRRAHAVLLHLKFNKTAKDVAQLLSISQRTVQKYWKRFKQEGLALFESKRHRCGRKPVFSTEELEAAFHKIQDEAQQGSLLTALQIRQQLEKSTQKHCSRSSVYTILKRHGWSKKKPRPKHPKGDPQEQTLFKKTS